MKPCENYDWFVGSTSTESTCLSVKLFVNNLADQPIIETYIGIHGTQPTHIYITRYPSNNLGFQLGFEGVSYLVHLRHIENFLATLTWLTQTKNNKIKKKKKTRTNTSKMDPRNKSWSSEKKNSRNRKPWLLLETLNPTRASESCFNSSASARCCALLATRKASARSVTSWVESSRIQKHTSTYLGISFDMIGG